MTAVEWFAKQVLEYKSPTNMNGTDYILIPTNKIEFLQEQAKEMENKATFEQAVKPLMKWLCENAHPHTTAIVDGTLAQLVEGVESVKTEEFLVD